MGIWKLTKMNFPKKILGENMSLSIENISTLWSTAEIIVNSFRAEKGINIIQIFYTLLLRIWLKKKKKGNFMPYVTHLFRLSTK